MSDKTPREKVQVEPHADDPELFEWLERLFDGPTEFPELIDVFPVSGPRKEKPGDRLEQIIFSPQAKDTRDKDEKREAKVGDKDRAKKPTREELVAMSNRIRNLCQRHCNALEKKTTYGVHASHFLRGADYYSRFIFTLKTKVTATRGHGGESFGDDDEDESLSAAERYYRQKLAHDERMFHAYGAGFEGLLDRQDRALERSSNNEDKLRASNERLLDMVERLQSNQHERNMQLAWNDLKIKSVEKGMELAIGLAPPIINQLTGKKLIQTSETAESITLKNFFKAATDGGSLTVEQADAAFGKHDNDGNLLKPGVLSKEQVTLLWEVAHCTRPTDELDRVLTGGSLEVTQVQMAQLQQIFSMEQLAPIGALIMLRMQNRQQQPPTQTQQPQQQ